MAKEFIALQMKAGTKDISSTIFFMAKELSLCLMENIKEPLLKEKWTVVDNLNGGTAHNMKAIIDKIKKMDMANIYLNKGRFSREFGNKDFDKEMEF
jgi:hypothetical protein